MKEAPILLEIENKLYMEGYRLIAGVDEVGRGPLAGPVVTAACILPPNFDLPGLNDSKRLSERKREVLSGLIKEQAVAWSLGSASVEEIDSFNILQATKLAMQRAIEDLSVKPEYILIDGRDSLPILFPQKTVIGGDGLSASIAAASILAKVARDALMCELSEVYPGYGFDLHKGYGTTVHMAAIQTLGPCAIHRRSFSPVREIVS